MTYLKEAHRMALKPYIPVVAMIGLVIFFIWGWLDTFQHSWLIFIVVGIAIVFMSIYDKEHSKGNE